MALRRCREIRSQEKELGLAIRKGRKEGYAQYNKEEVLKRLHNFQKEEYPMVLVYVCEDEDIVVSAYPYVMALYLEEYDILEMLEAQMKKWLEKPHQGGEYDILCYSNLNLDVDSRDFYYNVNNCHIGEVWTYKNMMCIARGDERLLPLYLYNSRRDITSGMEGLRSYYNRVRRYSRDLVKEEECLDDFITFIKYLEKKQKLPLLFEYFKNINELEKIITSGSQMRDDDIDWKLLISIVEGFEFLNSATILETQKRFLNAMKFEENFSVDIYLLALQKGFFPKESLLETIKYCEETGNPKVKRLLLLWRQSQDCNQIRQVYYMFGGR